MDKKQIADRKGDASLHPEPVLLTREETLQVSGGLNPQPLPPCRELET
jgi:hypothetical protein